LVSNETTKKRMKELEPIIQTLNLRLSQATHLTQMGSNDFYDFIKKFGKEKEQPKQSPDFIMDKVFLKKLADFMYALAKTSTPPTTKIVPSQKYTVSLYGNQIFTLYRKSSSIYNFLEKIENEHQSLQPQPTS
jgi:hypothetical protein